MKILITGASGFVGRELSTKLIRKGHQVSALVRHPDPSLPVGLSRQHVVGEGLSPLIEAFRAETPDVVIHLAAVYAFEHAPEQLQTLLQANIVFGSLVLEAMRSVGCKRIVTAGTAWQNGEDGTFEPVNLYAATKQAFEAICTFYCVSEGMRAIHLHTCDTYGEDDHRRKLLELLEESTTSESPLSLSPGEQRISLVHIDDACDAFAIAAAQTLAMEEGEHRVRALLSDWFPTLRELVGMFNRADPTLPARVIWGGRAYRRREPMFPHSAPIRLEGHRNLVGLDEGLRRFRSRHASNSWQFKETA
jgi:nucleoside-diphosphate-sugar epimerase